MGLTCALLQLDAVAHVDVVDSNVASGRMIKKSFKHHLDEKRDTQVGIIELLFLKHRAAEEELWCFKDSIKERIKKKLPDTLWGSEAEWCDPPSSGAPGLL